MSDSRNRTAGVLLLGMLLALASSGSAVVQANDDEGASLSEDASPSAATCPDQAPDDTGEDRKPDLGRPPYNVWDRIDRFDGQPRSAPGVSHSLRAGIAHIAGSTSHRVSDQVPDRVVKLTPVDRMGPSHRPHGPPC